MIDALREDSAGRAAIVHRIGRQRGEDHAQILFPFQTLESGGAVRRGDDHFEKKRFDREDALVVEFAVDADDPAERRNGIGLDRAAQRLRNALPAGDAARIRVLDDRRCRFAEGMRQPDRRVEVQQVVVRKLFSLKLIERFSVGVEGGFLLRILAVAEVLELRE